MRFQSLVRPFFAPTPLASCLQMVFLLPCLTLLTLTSWFKRGVEEPLIAFNAWLAHALLGLLGFQAELSGRVVRTGGFAAEIVSGCTGLFVFILLLAATLAFPTRWGSRAKALATGAALIFILNQVRIVSLMLLGTAFPQFFEEVHVYVWQGIIIFLVAFYWYSWARSAPPRRVPAAAESQASL